MCLITLIFRLCFFHRLCMTDFPCMGQHLFSSCPQDVIQMLHIIAHIHGPMTDGLYLSEVEVTGYHLVQYSQFFLCQIILGDPYIFRCGKIAGKSGKPHKWLTSIDPLIDDLRSRMPMRCWSLFCTILKNAMDSALLGL